MFIKTTYDTPLNLCSVSEHATETNKLANQIVIIVAIFVVKYVI